MFRIVTETNKLKLPQKLFYTCLKVHSAGESREAKQQPTRTWGCDMYLFPSSSFRSQSLGIVNILRWIFSLPRWNWNISSPCLQNCVRHQITYPDHSISLKPEDTSLLAISIQYMHSPMINLTWPLNVTILQYTWSWKNIRLSEKGDNERREMTFFLWGRELLWLGCERKLLFL